MLSFIWGVGATLIGGYICTISAASPQKQPRENTGVWWCVGVGVGTFYFVDGLHRRRQCMWTVDNVQTCMWQCTVVHYPVGGPLPLFCLPSSAFSLTGGHLRKWVARMTISAWECGLQGWKWRRQVLMKMWLSEAMGVDERVIYKSNGVPFW